MKEGNFCCHKTTERSEKEYKSHDEQTEPHRGTDPWHQGNGGTETRTVTDILIQVAAVNAALNSVSTRSFWQSHIRNCVVRGYP